MIPPVSAHVIHALNSLSSIGNAGIQSVISAAWVLYGESLSFLFFFFFFFLSFSSSSISTFQSMDLLFPDILEDVTDASSSFSPDVEGSLVFGSVVSSLMSGMESWSVAWSEIVLEEAFMAVFSMAEMNGDSEWESVDFLRKTKYKLWNKKEN